MPSISARRLLGLSICVMNAWPTRALSNIRRLRKSNSSARHFYNGNVRDYRNRCESFPGVIVAEMFNFELRDFFNVAPAVRVAHGIQGLHES